MNDPYDNSTPKYNTAQSIYDALCELVQTEEMSIISEMYPDVSYDGQDYYYTDNGYRLKTQFDELAEYGNKMWIMDLAIYQIDRTEVHDIIWDALHNTDLAKRLGFKHLFIETMLRGDKTDYDKIIEEYGDALNECNRFDRMTMQSVFRSVMEPRGVIPSMAAYPNLCTAISIKALGLKLYNECRVVAECRAILSSYDDFIMGLRTNQQLFSEIQKQYDSKILKLQTAFDERVRQLYILAELQGVTLTFGDNILLPPPVENDNKWIADQFGVTNKSEGDL